MWQFDKMYNDRCKKQIPKKFLKAKGFYNEWKSSRNKSQNSGNWNEKYFGSLVSNFNLIDAFYGNGHEEFSLGFKYCDYFDMRFNYGQGACGCCICYDWGDNNEAILIKTSIDGWWEKFQFNGKIFSWT